MKEINDCYISHSQLVSESSKIYILHFASKQLKAFMYEGYSEITQIGQYFSLTHKKITRLYTTVNCLVYSNRLLMNDIIKRNPIEGKILNNFRFWPLSWRKWTYDASEKRLIIGIEIKSKSRPIKLGQNWNCHQISRRKTVWQCHSFNDQGLRYWKIDSNFGQRWEKLIPNQLYQRPRFETRYFTLRKTCFHLWRNWILPLYGFGRLTFQKKIHWRKRTSNRLQAKTQKVQPHFERKDPRPFLIRFLHRLERSRRHPLNVLLPTELSLRRQVHLHLPNQAEKGKHQEAISELQVYNWKVR